MGVVKYRLFCPFTFKKKMLPIVCTVLMQESYILMNYKIILHLVTSQYFCTIYSYRERDIDIYGLNHLKLVAARIFLPVGNRLLCF